MHCECDKAFDHVPHGVLRVILWEYGVQDLLRGCPCMTSAGACSYCQLNVRPLQLILDSARAALCPRFCSFTVRPNSHHEIYKDALRLLFLDVSLARYFEYFPPWRGPKKNLRRHSNISWLARECLGVLGSPEMCMKGESRDLCWGCCPRNLRYVHMI